MVNYFFLILKFLSLKFDFAIFKEDDGRRLFRPFSDHIRDLGSSPDFHAKMTRTPRTDSVGHSWRDIKWGLLYLPRTHTPWNSKRASRPDLRGSMDYRHALDRLKQIPQLQPAVLHGSDKVLTPHRLRTLGGLARITAEPKRKNVQTDFCRPLPLLFGFAAGLPDPRPSRMSNGWMARTL